jgi:signal transduction histidine kinase
VPIKLALTKLNPLPPPETKLALYRIFEEALRNVEKHARARLVTVRLTQLGAFAQLAIKDDGIGFDPDDIRAKRKGADGLGLPRMRERAGFMGAALTIKSAPRAGTEVKVRIPLPQELTGPRKMAIRARAAELPHALPHTLPRATRRSPGQR